MYTMKIVSFSGLERTMELKILRMSFFQFMGIELNLKDDPKIRYIDQI